MGKGILGLILVLLLVGGLVYVLQINQIKKPVSSVVTPIPTNKVYPTEAVSPSSVASASGSIGKSLSIRPNAVVQSFYQWYFTCSRQENSRCDVTAQETVDSKKMDALMQKAKGYNPIVCGQDAPTTFRIDRTTEPKDGKASVYVIESYGAGSDRQVIVEVEEQQREWKIVNIICPRP